MWYRIKQVSLGATRAVDTLKSIQVFQDVAKLRSFSLAAQRAGITVAMASRYVKNIEDMVGARLLNRTSRKVSLTEAGEIYLAKVAPAVESLDEANILASESTTAAKGRLKILLPAMMSTPIFSGFIAEFREAHKDVTLHFEVSSNTSNIIEDGFDLGLHVGKVNAEGLIAKRMADVRSVLVASPILLNEIGRPQTFQDIMRLPFVLHISSGNTNKLQLPRKNQMVTLPNDPVLRTENEMMALHTVLAGVGAALLPEWLVTSALDKKLLEVIMPETVFSSLPLYLLYPDRTYLPAKTRSFIDFMANFEVDENRFIYSIEQF